MNTHAAHLEMLLAKYEIDLAQWLEVPAEMVADLIDVLMDDETATKIIKSNKTPAAWLQGYVFWYLNRLLEAIDRWDTNSYNMNMKATLIRKEGSWWVVRDEKGATHYLQNFQIQGKIEKGAHGEIDYRGQTDSGIWFMEITP